MTYHKPTLQTTPLDAHAAGCCTGQTTQIASVTVLGRTVSLGIASGSCGTGPVIQTVQQTADTLL